SHALVQRVSVRHTDARYGRPGRRATLGDVMNMAISIDHRSLAEGRSRIVEQSRVDATVRRNSAIKPPRQATTRTTDPDLASRPHAAGKRLRRLAARTPGFFGRWRPTGVGPR